MMLRKLVCFLVVFGMLAFSAGTAWSAAFIPGGSSYSVRLAGLPLLETNGNPTAINDVTLSGGVLTVGANVFQTSGLTIGTSLLTAVALIQNLTLNASNNAGTLNSGFVTGPAGTGGGGASGTLGNPWGGNLTGSAAVANSATLCPSGCLGGFSMNSTGAVVINVGGGFTIPFDLQSFGIGGVSSVTLGGAPLSVQAGPWITGKARLTNINTNVVTVPSQGGKVGVLVTLDLTPDQASDTVGLTINGNRTSTTTNATPVRLTENTVTFTGTNSLTASGAGTVTLISPIVVSAPALGLGSLPGVFRTTFKFVPEPGTVLLLVSGAAGLALIGRNRMKS
ncbi:MAG: PEP-CTERM sorting domain-containing protein [Myxococcota bacterium]|nr:hypothetical protein [Deltaproteobacteria bacterium]